MSRARADSPAMQAITRSRAPISPCDLIPRVAIATVPPASSYEAEGLVAAGPLRRSPSRTRRLSRRLRPGRLRSRRAVALGRIFILGIAGLLEDDDVLPGEELQRVLEGEPLRLDLTADLLEGHLVLG